MKKEVRIHFRLKGDLFTIIGELMKFKKEKEKKKKEAIIQIDVAVLYKRRNGYYMSLVEPLNINASPKSKGGTKHKISNTISVLVGMIQKIYKIDNSPHLLNKTDVN